MSSLPRDRYDDWDRVGGFRAVNPIFGLLLLVGAFGLVAAALAFGAWVVRPVDRAARGRRH